METNLSTGNSAFTPDDDSACLSCGASPTVVAIRDGKIVATPGLCGPCCFGTAAAWDPTTWND